MSSRVSILNNTNANTASSLLSDSNHTPTSSSTGNGNLESLMAGPVAVLKFLDETQDAVRKSLIMAFVTFTLMSLPWFWPYQQ